MNFRIAFTILKKELLDTLRDRRTLIMMLGVPIVLYPTLMIFGMQVAIVQQNKLEETRSRIAVEGPSATLLTEWLKDAEKVDVVASEAPREDLLGGKIEAIVSTEGDLEPGLAQGGTVPIEILYDSTELESQDASNRVESALKKRGESLLAQRLEKAGLAQAFVRPLEVKEKDVAPPRKTSGTILGLILPPIMVLMIALGAFYPAIDLTAGEKERGTFETLLSTPASKLEIVTGKFLTVFLLAMATGALNLASMSVTFLFVMSQISKTVQDPQLLQQFQLPVQVFLFMFIMMVPLGFLLSAMMMSVAVFAKGFKEAQNYITPFFLIILLPSFMGAVPGAELTPFTQFVPIYNVVLLFKELMTGKSGLEEAGTVFISTAAFAGLALWFAAWLFQREEVVLSEERGISLTIRRSDIRPRPTLTPGSALGWYAIMLILLFYLGSLVQQWNLLPGLLITQFFILLGPTLLFLWFFKIDLKTALNLRAPSLAGMAGTLLTGLGAIVLLMQFSTWHNRFLPMPKMLEEEFMKLFQTQDLPGGVFTLVLIIACAPALCEELFMRGAVLSGLRARLGPWVSILLVGTLFGLLHISIYRIIPTAMLGMVLTYAVVRTGSIWTSVVVHAINNTFGVLLATGHAPEWVKHALNLERVEQSGLPVWTIAGAAVLLVSGVVLTEWTTRRLAKSTR